VIGYRRVVDARSLDLSAADRDRVTGSMTGAARAAHADAAPSIRAVADHAYVYGVRLALCVAALLSLLGAACILARIPARHTEAAVAGHTDVGADTPASSRSVSARVCSRAACSPRCAIRRNHLPVVACASAGVTAVRQSQGRLDVARAHAAEVLPEILLW